MVWDCAHSSPHSAPLHIYQNQHASTGKWNKKKSHTNRRWVTSYVLWQWTERFICTDSRVLNNSTMNGEGKWTHMNGISNVLLLLLLSLYFSVINFAHMLCGQIVWVQMCVSFGISCWSYGRRNEWHIFFFHLSQIEWIEVAMMCKSCCKHRQIEFNSVLFDLFGFGTSNMDGWMHILIHYT